jgi:hypothetical protein
MQLSQSSQPSKPNKNPLPELEQILMSAHITSLNICPRFDKTPKVTN